MPVWHSSFIKEVSIKLAGVLYLPFGKSWVLSSIGLHVCASLVARPNFSMPLHTYDKLGLDSNCLLTVPPFWDGP